MGLLRLSDNNKAVGEVLNILVSACLLGCACRYDGKSKPCGEVIALSEKYNLIPVCPEIFGGLPTPRDASEISGGRVVSKSGADNTQCFLKGAQETLRLAEIFGCRAAILKAKSPSCGSGFVYDGSFSRKLIPGNGITARLLIENGLKIYTENDIGGADL